MFTSSDVFRYDRKERSWLIQSVLSGRLFRQIEDCIRRKVPDFAIRDDADWSLDFHIDSLIAALEVSGASEDWHVNPEVGPDRKRLIRGSIEDFDLIVVSGRDVILVEAKGVRAWNEGRLCEKLRRLDYLAPVGQGSEHSRGCRLFFIMTSPGHELPALSLEGSHWLIGGRLPWVRLHPAVSDGVHWKVVRSDINGERYRVEKETWSPA